MCIIMCIAGAGVCGGVHTTVPESGRRGLDTVPRQTRGRGQCIYLSP